ncbi:MAG: inorganic diphosphatase [Treponema sp.]|nr:inorganic diphosphatase [Treponema sp.]
MGSYHPRKPELFYPVNYGFVEGVIGGDGAEQDVYILGVDKPLKTFTGKIIAVLHRYDDNETKWIVVPEECADSQISDDEIYAQLSFIEQFFTGVLVRRASCFLSRRCGRRLSPQRG